MVPYLLPSTSSDTGGAVGAAPCNHHHQTGARLKAIELDSGRPLVLRFMDGSKQVLPVQVSVCQAPAASPCALSTEH